MLVGDLIYSEDFDANCNFAVYKGIWNEGGELLWNSKTGKPSCALRDREIKYLTIDVDRLEIVIEIKED